MSNKYAGYCADCKASCGPNHGELVKVGGKWQVRCGGKAIHSAPVPAKHRSSRAPSRKDGEKLTQAEMMARAVDLSVKAGVEISATDAKSYMAEGGVVVGSTRKTKKDGWVLVVALGAYDRYYHSEDDCEDMDCFCHDYGWHEEQHYYGIQCSEPGGAKAERESKEAKIAEAKVAVEAKLAAWQTAQAQIPAEFKTRHGALIVPVAMGLLQGSVKWEQIGTDVQGQYGNTLYRADLSDGRPVYRITHIQYDDWRETYYLPEDVWQAVCIAEIRGRGITRAKAEAWLAEYRGCVGTELYEFAATLQPAPETLGTGSVTIDAA